MSVEKDWLFHIRRARGSLGADLVGLPIALELRHGWAVRRQFLRRDLVYFCLEGGFQIRSLNGSQNVRRGDVVVVPAGRAFDFVLGTYSRARVARFQLVRSQRVVTPVGAIQVYHFGNSTEAWLSVLRAELSGTVRPDAVSLALRGLFLSIERPSFRVGYGRWRKLTVFEKERIHAWADSLAPSSRPDLADLSRILDLSPEYCARLFRQSFGMPFESWLIARRMRAAAVRLQESSLTISAISEEYGYSTPFFFSRQFKMVMGCSPRHFRTGRR